MIELRIFMTKRRKKISNFFENLLKRYRLHFEYILKAKTVFESKMFQRRPPIYGHCSNQLHNIVEYNYVQWVKTQLISLEMEPITFLNIMPNLNLYPRHDPLFMGIEPTRSTFQHVLTIFNRIKNLIRLFFRDTRYNFQF